MKLGLSLIIGITLFVTLPLSAQEDSTASTETSHELFITGGISYPYLPTTFKVNFLNGTNVGFGSAYKLAPGSLGYSKLTAAVEYNLFKFDEASYLKSADTNIVLGNPGLTASQRPVKIFTFTMGYQGTFTCLTDILSPYFTMGLGFMYLSVPPLVTNPTTSLEEAAYNNFTLTWSVGVGVDVPISESLGAFVQARSMIGVLTETRQYFPVSLGVRYTMP